MSDTNRIAIVTVVKNDACSLEQTIISILKNKGEKVIDLLIIDGGSTDGTLDVIERYAEHLCYWVSEPDGGIYDAMNKGWAAAANGSFIWYLGAGDLMLSVPETKQYSPHQVIYGSVLMGEQMFFAPRPDYHLKLYNSLHHQALLVNKAFHPSPPFNCSYRVYADFDFNQRLKKMGASFVYSPDLKAYARPGGTSDGQHFFESVKVVRNNCGILWASLAITGYYTMMIFPMLKRLRPIKAR